MAKRPEAVKPSEVKAVISQKKLRGLLAHARSTKADVDEVVGTHRQQIADAVENHHLHKGAFGMIKRLDRLEPEKLADWMDHFEHMYEVSGLRERAASAPRMEMGEDEPGEDEGEKQPKRGKNVTAFPAPTGQAAE